MWLTQVNISSHQQLLEIRITIIIPGLANKQNETQIFTTLDDVSQYNWSLKHRTKCLLIATQVTALLPQI